MSNDFFWKIQKSEEYNFPYAFLTSQIIKKVLLKINSYKNSVQFAKKKKRKFLWWTLWEEIESLLKFKFKSLSMYRIGLKCGEEMCQVL